jgi:hypothetical protein
MKHHWSAVGGGVGARVIRTTVSATTPVNGYNQLTGLRSMWQAHVRHLSEQVHRLLSVYSNEERGIDVLRT